MFERVNAFVRDVSKVDTRSDLEIALAQISKELGFAYFALSNHIDLQAAPQQLIRIHNYPLEWVRYFDDHRLGLTDPVHRACRITGVGFGWSDLPRMLPLTSTDRRLLELAAKHGLSERYTVPAHVPGDIQGSCSFANARGRRLQPEQKASAQLVGSFAFEVARRLLRLKAQRLVDPARVSKRERECLIWVARGKSDREIATILGISTDTVHQYVKALRGNYDAVSRSQLIAQAIFTGTIGFEDIFSR